MQSDAYMLLFLILQILATGVRRGSMIREGKVGFQAPNSQSMFQKSSFS